ncbi:hypothetical protein BDY19DRAFT_939989 [Irpex rosettiformis]|uniref:Uncharacterized protein n=1 Tax=Irpex rosettiformis TaxID=378272 RepID=A0ACB8U831_9APHY|nr:hypothetical protein BDY19DRAFT_939989 [Irpex rosettiformis]
MPGRPHNAMKLCKQDGPKRQENDTPQIFSGDQAFSTSCALQLFDSGRNRSHYGYDMNKEISDGPTLLTNSSENKKKPMDPTLRCSAWFYDLIALMVCGVNRKRTR